MHVSSNARHPSVGVTGDVFLRPSSYSLDYGLVRGRGGGHPHMQSTRPSCRELSAFTSPESYVAARVMYELLMKFFSAGFSLCSSAVWFDFVPHIQRWSVVDERPPAIAVASLRDVSESMLRPCRFSKMTSPVEIGSGFLSAIFPRSRFLILNQGRVSETHLSPTFDLGSKARLR